MTPTPRRLSCACGPIPLRSRRAGDPYAPAATITVSAVSRPLSETTPTRPPSGDLDAVDECLGGNRQVRPRPCVVEIRERSVPANCSHGVDGRRSDADGGVEVVEIRESGQSDARTGLEQRAMERRQVVRAIRPRADRGFGPAQVRLELGERPAVSPLVVVVTRAPHDEARVVSRATAEDARARGRPVVGLGLPEVRHRQGASVEHVRGPASFRVAAVVRSRLDKADRPLRLLAQSCGEHAARRPSTHDDHVEALGHPPTLTGGLDGQNARKPRRYSRSELCPRQELNLCTRFRKPLLYPLSYGGPGGCHDSEGFTLTPQESEPGVVSQGNGCT